MNSLNLPPVGSEGQRIEEVKYKSPTQMLILDREFFRCCPMFTLSLPDVFRTAKLRNMEWRSQSLAASLLLPFQV